jgi:hypothetical protein
MLPTLRIGQIDAPVWATPTIKPYKNSTAPTIEKVGG